MCNRKCQKNNGKILKIKKYQYEYISSQNRLETSEKERNKNYRSVSLLPVSKQKIPKKIAKKFQKLKNTITASFQAKIGWKRLRKRENKNYCSVPFLPDA